MATFFKRLSRSRGNSYVEDDYSPRSEKYEHRPTSSRVRDRDLPNSTASDTEIHRNGSGGVIDDSGMYPRPSGPQATLSSPPRSGINGRGHNAMPTLGLESPVGGGLGKAEPMPDLLTRAFNEAVRPYTDKIEQLEGEIADLRNWVEQLEIQRSEMHSWIDKRGLRPDVPPSLAKVMDTTSDAAVILNAQLDRKITIVNFDLHRLQDDLNDSISSSHFASAMLKFLPDIDRLASLPRGPGHAFDLILKLGGNLNSHGGLDSGDPADIEARQDFYAQLDNSMVDIVRRRLQENEDWPIMREIKRIDKTAAHLKLYGVEPYFPKTLECMRSEIDYRQGGGGAGGAGGSGAVTQPNGSSQPAMISEYIKPQDTPPRYH